MFVARRVLSMHYSPAIATTSKSAGAPPSWALWPDGKLPVMTSPQTQTPPPQQFSAEALDVSGDAPDLEILEQKVDGLAPEPAHALGFHSGRDSDMSGWDDSRKRARAHPAEPDGTASARSFPTCCTPVVHSFGLNVKVISGYLAARRDKACDSDGFNS